MRAARRALEWKPDLVYAWNGSSIPQSSLRVLADSGVPLAFRVCEHWFGALFLGDQFMRELLPARRSPAPGRVGGGLSCAERGAVAASAPDGASARRRLMELARR